MTNAFNQPLLVNVAWFDDRLDLSEVEEFDRAAVLSTKGRGRVVARRGKGSKI